MTGQPVETIEATRQHPFYVEGKGFVAAAALGIGSAIVTRAGPPLVVGAMAWERRAEGYDVYNLTVEGDHTYFVGNIGGGVWVHNGDGTCIPDVSSVKQALEGIQKGDVRVGTRSEAEEVARRGFSGYKNTTGEARREADLLARMNQNPGYYHWADEVENAENVVRVKGHSATDVHGQYRHLQAHTFGGKTIRVFYGNSVR